MANVEKIIQYQIIDGELKKIENDLASSEEKKKASQAKKFLDGVSVKHKEIDDKAAQLLQNFTKQEELSAKIAETITEFSSVVESCEDEKEIEYYKKKVGEYVKKVKAIETEINKIKGEIADLMKLYKGLKANSDAAKAQYNEFAPKYNELKQSKQAEAEKIQKKLLLLAKEVDPAILEIYKSKRKDKMYPIFYKVEDSCCSYCRNQLSLLANSLLTKEGYIECDNCHRILYK